jgi:hypothetical protein
MNRKAIATGIMALCLITVIFMAGCTSQSQGNASLQTPAQQPAVTIMQAAGSAVPQGPSAAEGSSAATDQGLVSDDVGNAVAQAQAFNATQETNSTPDSEDFGDIMP